MTPEAKVKQQVRTMLQKGGFWFFAAVAGRSVAGIPDYICCKRGRFLAIEVKAEGGALTPLQEKTLNDIHMHGGRTFIAWPNNLDDLQLLLDSYDS